MENFIGSTSDVEGAVLVSPDGLTITSVLPNALDDERTSAMSAAMLSLGDCIAKDLARGDIERVLVEGLTGYGIVVGCGEDMVLLVLANKNGKQGILFLAINSLVKEISPLLV
ncbi:MAG: roadblock/LC7 domain-containing protein [Prochloraceae cyanobacterium]|nr:roadblock/LC7 domain-containing protein [Prochloraceae cyanobacterium]